MADGGGSGTADEDTSSVNVFTLHPEQPAPKHTMKMSA